MVTPYYYPVVGGTETVIEDLSVKLMEMGIAADVMTFDMSKRWNVSTREKTETINGVKVIKVAAWNFLPGSLNIDKILTRFGMINLVPLRFTEKFRSYDIIHFHNDADLSFPFFSLLTKKPKIFHSHVLSITYKFYIQNPVTKLILRHLADLYLAPSRYSLDLLTKLGVRASKVRLLPNGIDIDSFRPGKGNKVKNMLLFVGRIDPCKGVHILLRSLDYLKSPVHLIIIGPMSSDDAYDAEILKLISEINGKKVHKVTYMGSQDRKEIVRWYQQASIFVLPSLQESFGVAAMEALSCETPVIASKVGGLPEIIQNVDNRVLVQPNNAVELAEHVQFLLDNEDFRKRLGAKGRAFVTENYSLNAVVKDLIEIYKEIID